MLHKHLGGVVPRAMGMAGGMRFMGLLMLTFMHPPALLEAAGLHEHDSLKVRVFSVQEVLLPICRMNNLYRKLRVPC